jgi:FkbM family methyltransferase
MKIVQVGTNNGADHVRDFVKKQSNVDFLLLVEPFSIHNVDIEKNYQDIKYNIENVAITADSDKVKQLFYAEADGPERNPQQSFQVASVVPEHLYKHGHRPHTLKSVTVNCLTINELFDKYQLKHIDYLFLDIEGIDFEVLTSIDFKNVVIDNLQVEHLHLDYKKLIDFMESVGFVSGVSLDYHVFDTMFKRVQSTQIPIVEQCA